MRSLLLARRGENSETRLKLLTIADGSATYSQSVQMPARIVIAVQIEQENTKTRMAHRLLLVMNKEKRVLF